MQRAPERLREILHGDDPGRHEVERAGQVVVDGPEDRPDLVGDVDPGEPLLPAADRPAHEGLERREHLLQRASLGAEHPPVRIWTDRIGARCASAAHLWTTPERKAAPGPAVSL